MGTSFTRFLLADYYLYRVSIMSRLILSDNNFILKKLNCLPQYSTVILQEFDYTFIYNMYITNIFMNMQTTILNKHFQFRKLDRIVRSFLLFELGF